MATSARDRYSRCRVAAFPTTLPCAKPWQWILAGGPLERILNLYKVIPCRMHLPAIFRDHWRCSRGKRQGHAEQWLRRRLSAFRVTHRFLRWLHVMSRLAATTSAQPIFIAPRLRMLRFAGREAGACTCLSRSGHTHAPRCDAADCSICSIGLRAVCEDSQNSPLPHTARSYNGSAPVVIAPRRQAAQAPAEQHPDPSPELDLPQLSPSSSTQAPQQSTPVYVRRPASAFTARCRG